MTCSGSSSAQQVHNAAATTAQQQRQRQRQQQQLNANAANNAGTQARLAMVRAMIEHVVAAISCWIDPLLPMLLLA